MSCVNRTVYKTFIFLLLVTNTLTIYAPYGKFKIDYGMSFIQYGEKTMSQQWDRNWLLMKPDEKIASLRSSEKRSLRVIAGIEDKSNKYPYVVALGARPEDISLSLQIIFNNTAFSEFLRTCTGSLISEQWVLTAAHCCTEVKLAKIRYGNMTVPPNDALAAYSNILKIYIHPSYFFMQIIKNDIALLLVNRVRLSVYGRVSAVDYRTLVGLPVKYVGLGSTNTSLLHDQVRNRLYGEAAVATCSNTIKLLKFYPMLCLIRKCANLVQVSDHGDSGGPLLQAGDIVGVLTGEITELNHVRGTDMYTATSPFLDWIRTKMHTATPSSEN